MLWSFGGVMPEQFYAWVLNADGEAFKTRKYSTHELFERIAQVYLSAPDVVKLDVFRLDVTGKTKLINTLRKK